ncbi:hypothetical protein CPT_Machias_120 [Staphylococcus phage Machias]|nr:hypothetical protein CPT_Machias_120 [Staphylococcus phage Machias]
MIILNINDYRYFKMDDGLMQIHKDKIKGNITDLIGMLHIDVDRIKEDNFLNLGLERLNINISFDNLELVWENIKFQFSLSIIIFAEKQENELNEYTSSIRFFYDNEERQMESDRFKKLILNVDYIKNFVSLMVDDKEIDDLTISIFNYDKNDFHLKCSDIVIRYLYDLERRFNDKGYDLLLNGKNINELEDNEEKDIDKIKKYLVKENFK